MSENVDVLRGGYEAFARGDMDGVRATWADDIQWEGPNTPELPGSGTRRGADEVIQMIGEIANNWEDFSVTPDEFVDGGDTVVVLGHTQARAKATGRDVKVPFVHIWRMSGGKANRVQTLSDTAELVKALG